ncbi:MAG: DUF1697 domain-containing protein [Tannerella sp.]|jgi:uncharacterized protein (DUF1697 family)|nr:DUF1697 domain-containing protein [Tannerella sp.]
MEKIKYLALLRGLNVGGNNVIKMDRLKTLFEELHFTDVVTYIQSGNVIFNDFEEDRVKVSQKIEDALSGQLGHKITMALLTSSEMKDVVAKRPEGFGDDRARYKYDVLFLIAPLKPADVIKELKARADVDAICPGEKVLYISRLTSALTKSYFSKITETSIYRNVTIRNWNTTVKLYELMNNRTGFFTET